MEPRHSLPIAEAAALDAAAVRKVARLAKIALSDEEVEDARARLSAVLRHMACLQQMDLDGVEPMAHASDEPARLRDDEPGPALDRDALRGMLPAVFEASDPHGAAGEGGEPLVNVFIAVPKVLGEGGGA